MRLPFIKSRPADAFAAGQIDGLKRELAESEAWRINTCRDLAHANDKIFELRKQLQAARDFANTQYDQAAMAEAEVAELRRQVEGLRALRASAPTPPGGFGMARYGADRNTSVLPAPYPTPADEAAWKRLDDGMGDI